MGRVLDYCIVEREFGTHVLLLDDAVAYHVVPLTFVRVSKALEMKGYEFNEIKPECINYTKYSLNNKESIRKLIEKIEGN